MDAYQFSYPNYLRQYFQASPVFFSWDTFWKFAAGSFFTFLLIIVMGFGNEFDNGKEKILSLGLLGIIGLFSGFISIWLPTFLYKELNYIIGSLIQIIIVTSTFLKLSQMNSTQEQSKN